MMPWTVFAKNCIVIKGIPPERKENNTNLINAVRDILSHELDLPTEAEELDKVHRIGPVFKDNNGNFQQHTIARFKSHSARYSAYINRRRCRKNGLRIIPSLTNKRRKLLNSANEQYKDNPLVDFIFLGIYGDIKVKLADSVNGNHFHIINNIDEISWLLHETSEEDWKSTSEDSF